MNANPPIEKLFDSVRLHFLEIMAPIVHGRAVESCQSPIEQLFLVGLCTYWVSNYFHFPKLNGAVGGDTLSVTTQKQIGPYRVDFFLESGEEDNLNLVVECDGHDFHERTKEQAARDRKRDRYLQSQGLIVLRFTGSEIYRDPWKCAAEVQDQIYSAIHNRSKGAA